MAAHLLKKQTPTAYFVVAIVLAALFLHASYISSCTARFHNVHMLPVSESPENFPRLFIYRRTKKSGSSAMLDALLRILQPYNYTPLYFTGAELAATVRFEAIKPYPRRLLVAEHNGITRDFEPSRNAVIADTVRDGYEQITSYCRYVQKVKTCDEALIKCLESSETRKQNRYRWAMREREDDDTYIDLPLSSAHPAVSTTILRHVFPNATLDIYSWNAANTSCPEIPQLREVYDRLYKPLERQVETLRRRMLVLAGYPFKQDEGSRKILLVEMLAAAEAMELVKYDIVDHGPGTFGFSERHNELVKSLRHWSTDDSDSLFLTQRRE